MPYDFPPPVSISIHVGVFALYVSFLAFALAAILRVFAFHESLTKKSRIARLLVAVGLAVTVGCAGLVHPQTRGRLHDYLGFFAIISGSIALLTLIRQIRRRPPSLVRAPLAVFFGFVLAEGMSPLPPPFPNITPPAPWKTDCTNNLRFLHLAQENHASGRDGELSKDVAIKPGDPVTTWRVRLLPLMDRGDYTDDIYAFDKPWDASENLPVARIQKSQYSCRWNLFPADDSGRFYTNYARMTGPKTPFPVDRTMTLDGISRADGLSHTLLLGECSGLNIIWTEPRDIDVRTQKIGINLPGDSPRSSASILSSYHPGGAYAIFADGHVKFLSQAIDPTVLQALTTATGGESVPDGFD